MATAVRLGWAVLIAATLYICYFSHLGAIGFVGPDEPRYAWVARDMAETGDWITPRLYGKPWFEKPPLYYWAAALSFKFFGVSEAAARLPSALSALLATLALAWLARRLYGAETARWLLLLLPTTVGMIGFSHAAATDMPFSAMLTIALVAATVVLNLHRPSPAVPQSPQTPVPALSPSSRTRWLALIVFGVFLGAAVLAKGPVAIVLCGGTVFFWALFTKPWRDAFRLIHPAAVASFCVTALPWYILCARRNPDFLRVFLIEHNFQRYLTPEFHHIQPFWYYLPILIIGLLPWVMWIAWYAHRSAYAEDDSSHSTTTKFLTAWGLFPLLFFSISQSKLPGYILPSIPPLGLLIAIAATSSPGARAFFSRWVLILTGSLYLASGVWALYDLVSYRDKTHVHWTFLIGAFPMLFYLVPAAVGGLVVMSAGVLGRVRAGRLLAFFVFLFLIQVALDYLPKLNPGLSAKMIASEIGPADVENTYSYELQRSWHYALNFYFHREVPEWTPAIAGPAVVVVSEANMRKLRKRAEILSVISDSWTQAHVVKVRPLGDTISSDEAPTKNGEMP